MSAKTALDPVALRQAADEARNEAARLLDEADAAAIRAELSRRHAAAHVTLAMAEKVVERARARRDEALTEIQQAEAEQRERAERVRGALERELGEDLADEVSGRLVTAAVQREADERHAEIRRELSQAGAPSLMVEAALEALDDQERTARAERTARLDAANAEVKHAEAQQDAAAVEVFRLTDALDDPLNLDNFELCDGWLARLVRPAVYRQIIAQRVNKTAQIPEEVYALALASAREQWRLDAALCADLDQIDAQREALIKAQTELERVRRTAAITPVGSVARDGKSGWL